jgi:uncharacterized protein (DUF983 family)
MGDERPKHRTDIGAKMKCPKCGSDQVRAMSRAEMNEYLGGGDRFVLSVPRKCTVCGHGYKAIPSKAGYAVLFFAVLVTLGLVVLGALGSGLPLFAICWLIAGCLILTLVFSLLNKLASRVETVKVGLDWLSVIGTLLQLVGLIGTILAGFALRRN